MTTADSWPKTLLFRTHTACYAKSKHSLTTTPKYKKSQGISRNPKEPQGTPRNLKLRWGPFRGGQSWFLEALFYICEFLKHQKWMSLNSAIIIQGRQRNGLWHVGCQKSKTDTTLKSVLYSKACCSTSTANISGQ